MKRTIRLHATEGNVAVNVVANITTKGLTEDETTKQAEELTDRLMRALCGLAYTDLNLAHIRREK